MALETLAPLVGLLMLTAGARCLVDGSVTIARVLGMSELLIGLTIVAFGTSAPEGSVSFIAALEGNVDVAVGNVVGSSIFNITFIVGLSALVFPMNVQSETVRKEIPFALLAAVSLVVMISDLLLQSGQVNQLSRSEGIVLLLFFSIFLYYVFEVARNSRLRHIQRIDHFIDMFGTFAQFIKEGNPGRVGNGLA